MLMSEATNDLVQCCFSGGALIHAPNGVSGLLLLYSSCDHARLLVTVASSCAMGIPAAGHCTVQYVAEELFTLALLVLLLTDSPQNVLLD